MIPAVLLKSIFVVAVLGGVTYVPLAFAKSVSGNNELIAERPYLVVNIEDTKGRKMIVSGQKVIAKGEDGVDGDGLTFSIIDGNYKEIYKFDKDTDDDVKIEIKDAGKGMCFKDEETCNGKGPLKGSKFKFSTEYNNGLKMFVSQCKTIDKCHEGNKEFDIEKVVR